MKILFTTFICLFISLRIYSQRIEPDSTFDFDGYAVYSDLNSHYDAAYDLDIQSDGKIILVGDAVYNTADLYWKVERLNPDGSNDGTFHHPNFPPGGYGSAEAIKIQPDGKFLVSGQNGAA